MHGKIGEFFTVWIVGTIVLAATLAAVGGAAMGLHWLWVHGGENVQLGIKFLGLTGLLALVAVLEPDRR